MDTFYELEGLATSLSNEYYKLIILVGPSGTGKTSLINKFSENNGCKRINLSQVLSNKLKEVPASDRWYYIQDHIDEIIRDNLDDFLILDNIEIIFSKHLRIDPLRLLKNIAKYRKAIVAWSGRIKDGYLTYAEPWHRDYIRYSLQELECLYINLERGM